MVWSHILFLNPYLIIRREYDRNDEITYQEYFYYQYQNGIKNGKCLKINGPINHDSIIDIILYDHNQITEFYICNRNITEIFYNDITLSEYINILYFDTNG